MLIYLYQHWLEDLQEKTEFYKNFAILQGSFANPDMAKKMIKRDNPDFEADDEIQEASLQQMNQEDKEISQIKHRRKRRKLLVQS